jgi:glycosyltransferase involved in cell wall biosynthesis
VKKRLILSANAVVRRGGQGINLHHMIEGLGGMYDLSVFCQGSGADTSARHVPESSWSVRIQQIPILRRRRDWINLLTEANFDRQVSRQLEAADIFQGTTGQCLESLTVAQSKGCMTILDVLTLHNEHFHAQMVRESARFGIRPAQHPIMHKRVLEEYRRAELIRVMSEPARQTFLERGFAPEQVFIAAPPFDMGRFPKAEFRGSRFTVSFVGLLEPAKGFHYLIDAFRALNRPDAELLLWGGTGARALARYFRKQNAACPAIQVRPFNVSEIGPENVYGISSVLVHPSLADGFGLVVGEAMASGIPVITTTATGASQWIVDGVNGYIVPPGDSDAIRDRLEYLMDHPSLLPEMGRAARETIAQLTMERFRQSYSDAIAGNRKSAGNLERTEA